MEHDCAGREPVPDPDPERRELAEELLRAYLRETTGAPQQGLAALLAHQAWRNDPASTYPSGRAIVDAEPAVRVAFIRAAIDWSLGRAERDRAFGPALFAAQDDIASLSGLTVQLYRQRQPYTEADIVWILRRLAATTTTFDDLRRRFGYGLRGPVGSVARWIDDHGFPPAAREPLERLRGNLAGAEAHSDGRAVLRIIDRLVGDVASPQDLIDPRDDWGHAAAADLAAMSAGAREAWLAVLRYAAAARGAKPSGKWLAGARERIDALGADRFRDLVTRWLGFLEAPSRNTAYRRPDGFDYPSAFIADRNAELLKGLAWCCATIADAALATVVGNAGLACFRKIPMVGAPSTKAGNACIWALSALPGLDGVVQLQRLAQRVKLPSVQKQVEAALERAATRHGLTREDLDELSVPEFGVREGRAAVAVGVFTAQLSLAGTGAQLRWRSAAGHEQATVPAELKREFPGQVKALEQTVKSLRTALPGQRARIERLLLAERNWTLADWRARYLDHGVLSHFARRLIWTFGHGTGIKEGSWLDGQIVGVDDRPLAGQEPGTPVHLWHPLNSAPNVVLAWREWIERHAVTQPFKQAHREVYLLTDAEREAGTLSRRFAGHVLRQHQFAALCQERGWHYRLQGNWDSANTPTLDLPRWRLRAAFDVEGGQDDAAAPTSGHGIYLYIVSGDVMFRYSDGARRVPLAEVPPLAFSEVMRDVDLFVGVASIGTDPSWLDGDPDTVRRFGNYWRSYSRSKLAPSAETRRSVLERILPRLPALAERCALADRYLLVRGDLHDYRIHLGSGNVLMEPGNHYLCLVPGGGADNTGAGRIFLPFEGDATLSLILSKALLLADDRHITDASIVRQLGPDQAM